MNIPEHRRINHGRTWPSTYRPESYAAIERIRPSRIADAIVAVVLGVLCAALLVHGLTS